MEEHGLAIAEPKLLAVMENLHEHHGMRGHEIVLVFETVLAEADAYSREAFQFQDGVDNRAQWIDIARFRDGEEQLFPVGLIGQL